MDNKTLKTIQQTELGILEAVTDFCEQEGINLRDAAIALCHSHEAS